MIFDIPAISKAIAGGLIAVVVGEAARFGFHPQPETITALSVIVTAVASYVVGHVAVYWAPKNKE